MSVPLLLLLLAPLAGAVLAITFGVVAMQRRILVALCSAVMLGGGVAAVVRTSTAHPVAWRGFSLDPWTSLLVLGAVATVVAGIARATGTAEPGRAEAATFVASAAAIVPLAVPNVHLLAIALPVSTLAFGGAALFGAGDRVARLPARRATAALALSDVLTLVALGTGLSSGTALPPRLSLGPALVLLAGATIRIGMLPLLSGAGDALRSSPAVGAIWLGPIRAQGLAFVPFALTGGRTAAYAAGAAAAATVVVEAWRAARGAGLGSLTGAGVSFAVLGLAAGGPAGVWGAILAISATYVAVPAWAARAAVRDLSRPTAGALPAGALLPGAALVVAALFDAATARPGFFLLGVPALAAALALAASALAPEEQPGWFATRRDVVMATLAGWVGIAAAVGLSAIPERVTHALAFPAADALGVGRLLRTGAEPGLPDGLAVVMAVAALLAFLVGPGRIGAGGPPGGPARPVRVLPIPPALARIMHAERVWAVAATVLVAASVGVALRVYDVAAGRGFL